jgi:hypothetical protein
MEDVSSSSSSSNSVHSDSVTDDSHNSDLGIGDHIPPNRTHINSSTYKDTGDGSSKPHHSDPQLLFKVTYMRISIYNVNLMFLYVFV